MKTKELKDILRKKKIAYWRIGEIMGISEKTVWRNLCPAEISEEKGNEIIQAIEQIEKEARKHE